MAQERMKVKSDKPREKASRIFTDREELRAAFWKQYREKEEEILTSEGDGIYVVNYYGFGGIGKTTLLKKLMAEMEEQLSDPMYASYDFETAIDLRTALISLQTLLSQKYKFEFALFDLGLYIYSQKRGEKADPVEKEKLLSRSPLLSFVFSVADLAGLGLVTKVLSTIDEAASLARTKAHLKKNETLIKQLEYLDPEAVYKKLPELFSRDLAHNLEGAKKPLVLFLDTYERLVNEMSSTGEPLMADVWLRGEDGPVMNVPKVLWVIAGREKLKWDRFNPAWDTVIDSHILGTLSEKDSTSFLQGAGIVDEGLCHDLFKLTLGTPVYLDLCVECFENLQKDSASIDVSQFGQNDVELIERFVRYMDDAQKDLVYMIACLNKWDDKLLFFVAPRVLSGWSHTTYAKLKGYSFVLTLDNGYYSIHQTVGSVLADRCLDSIKQKTASAMKEYYELVLKDQGVLSSEGAAALVGLARAGLHLCRDREELRLFYEEKLASALGDLLESCRLEEAQAFFDVLLARVEEKKDDCLYSLLMLQKSVYLSQKGEYRASFALSQEVLAVRRALFGEDHVLTLSAMARLATAHQRLGNTAEAAKLDQTVFEKRKVMLGEDHPDTLSAMNNLAASLHVLGEYERSLGLKEEVLERRTRCFGKDHLRTLAAKNNLAVTLSALAEHERALTLRKEVLEKRREKLGESHPETLMAMTNLAATLHVLGHYDEALELKQKVVHIRTELFGENHPEVHASWLGLATTLAALGDYDGAERLESECLEKRRLLLGSDHPETLSAMNNLAATFHTRGKYREALALKQEVLEKRRALLGEEHPDTLGAMNNLAVTLQTLGNYENALRLRETVCEKRLALFGEDHPDTLSAQGNLANTLHTLKQYERALALNQAVLEKRSRIFGKDHPDTLIAVSNLALTLFTLGRSEEALQLRRELLETRVRIQGEDHPNTLDAMEEVAASLYQFGNYEECADAECALWKKRVRLLGEDHRKTLITQNNFALTLRALGRHDEALSLWQDTYEKRRAVLGEDHPDTVKSKEYLAATLVALDRREEALALREELCSAAKRVYGEGSKEALNATTEISRLLYDMRRYGEALRVDEGVLAGRVALFGGEHPDTLSAMYNVALELKMVGRMDEAVELMERVLEIRTRTLGRENPATVRALVWLNNNRKK
ncbi:MAG: tetratricopeptide repeat protein [Clostridia bacterium]|nr:tetratricopeptide repeat protein [Clostridia bacterium]